MNRTITIDPVTRVEGHAKVSIDLDDNGNVSDARVHILEFRGLEKLCEGRLYWEMPVLIERVCGICPVSHHIAAAKTCDDLVGVDIPITAKLIRELMHMGQMIQSHALHFFYLAAPDFIFGPSHDPEKRNIFGIMESYKDVAEKGIRLRSIGQQIIEITGGRKIHPVNAIPGGVATGITVKHRDEMLVMIDEAMMLAKIALNIAKKVYENAQNTVNNFGSPPTYYMSINNNGLLDLYDGNIRLADQNGSVAEEFKVNEYLKVIAEKTEAWSYLKFPYYKKKGYPEGIYRVGPLARLNVAKKLSTPLANDELNEFKENYENKVNHQTFYYHLARMIELLHAVERSKQILENPELTSKEFRVKVGRIAGEGVGCIEAPRGTLIHHYWTDEEGKITKANLIVATTHNNLAMNSSVKEVAKNYIFNNDVSEGLLNHVEMAIRCYDPCLSCSTHAVGQMPIMLEINNSNGERINSIFREEGIWM